jgi:hypothetical protein
MVHLDRRDGSAFRPALPAQRLLAQHQAPKVAPRSTVSSLGCRAASLILPAILLASMLSAVAIVRERRA